MGRRAFAPCLECCFHATNPTVGALMTFGSRWEQYPLQNVNRHWRLRPSAPVSF
jgi:hypothetical protein